MAQQLAPWQLLKKELYPGAALCAVVYDEDRGRLYSANSGDSRAVLGRRLRRRPEGPSATAEELAQWMAYEEKNWGFALTQVRRT